MGSYLGETLSKHTSFLGLRLWVLIVTFTTLFILLFFSIISCYLICYRRRKPCKTPFCLPNPIAPKNYQSAYCSSSLNRRLLPLNISEIEMNTTEPELEVMFPDQWSTRAATTTPRSYLPDHLEHFHKLPHGVPETRTSYRFSSREVDVFTDGFSYDNLIGNGNYGVVHRGVLFDGTTVAVKRLLSNSCQPEVFVTEAEAIGHVRHKNLVKLLGYCMEGHRMLVYEYVNNSNLHQWLHGPLGQASPLTWTIRMNIIHRIAKGLAYLHEDIEPHICHQNLKASNILLDHLWNPRISDVALSRLLGPNHTNATTRSLVELGYADQDNASISKWDKESDVYSFGILVMEIVSGRIPVDHCQHQIYLIDWLKSMVANKKIADVVDPSIPEIPSVKELKRITLIALRCVDPDIDHRPTMGEVIHMLEPRNMLLSDDHFVRREASLLNCTGGKPDVRIHDEDASDVYHDDLI
ncbi:Glutaminyl cyclase, putative isoform 1 [Hibiscus syriacus]|uniref:non-specific serine/threonine protein kinase n=2 Tax=Hibiscus syriacus TaxID=106335 RepID=A0A6A3B1Z2_HIBSY|nr:Glutaminyl cyclase, putative isoform 1 [Hibiscus syriacus]